MRELALDNIKNSANNITGADKYAKQRVHQTDLNIFVLI